jgi:peptide/nickel transport system permease protein
MGTYILRRLIYGVITLWLISIVTFMIFFLMPTGDPALRIAGKSPTPELLEQIREKYHFNDSLPEQYVYTMKQLLTGDIASFNLGTKVLPMIWSALPVTLSLCLVAATLWLSIGVTLGVQGAKKPGTKLDSSLTVVALLGLSLPTIWLAAMLLFVFTQKIPLFPPGDYLTVYRGGLWGWLYHLLLPAFTLVIVSAASYALVTRTNMRAALGEEWVKTALAKGLDGQRVFVHHIFRLGIIPIVIMFGMDLAATLQGAIFTETIFGLPGLGSVLMLGIRNLDFPILLTMVLFGAALIVVMNIVVDCIQAVLDPRIRLA